MPPAVTSQLAATTAGAAADASRLQTFAAMSAVLTGFLSSVIAPQLDPIDLKASYLATADAKAGTVLVDELLQQFRSLKGRGLPDQAIANALLATAGGAPAPAALLARSIVKLWYLGSWYDAAGNGNVVSANAYIGGLAWRAAQAHPMGASQLNFGYWASPPPPLEQFGVGSSADGGTTGGNHG